MSGSRNQQGLLLVALVVMTLVVSACAPVPAAPTAAAPEPVVPATAAPAPAVTATAAPLPTVAVMETPGQTAVGSSLDGRWEGAIDAMGQRIPIVLNINGMGGTVDFPSQSAVGIRLEKFSRQGNAVSFEVLPEPRTAVFNGEIEGDKMSGSFEQAGIEGTFNATRAIAQPAATVQPKDYRQEEVAFTNGAYTLAGTLTLPQGAGPHPAVVLISGSGAQNRDEELFGFKPFAVLADHLTKQGIAVLRYDDRGIGGSTTGTEDDTSETYAGDVRAAVNYLKGRSDINRSQIGLLGHSEGGIIAPIVATQDKDVAFLVLMAGTGVPGRELLPAQVGAIARASGMTEEEANAQVAEEERVIAAVLTGEGLEDVRADLVEQFKAQAEQMPEDQRKALGDLDQWAAQAVNGQLAQLGSPWMKFFLTHAPAAMLEKVDVPVLALFGGKDSQVPAATNEAAMKAALATGGNTDVTTKVFPEANHLFQAADTGSPTEYAELKPEFVPGFLDTISEWILSHVK